MSDEDMIFCDECGAYLHARDFEYIFSPEQANVCRECQDRLDHEEYDPDDYYEDGGEA